MASSERPSRLALDRLLLASVACIAFLFEASRSVVTNDLSIYIAMGRSMWAERALLDHDIFTWTLAGAPFLNGTWGFSLLAALAHKLVGYDGIRLLNGLLVSLTCLGVAWVSKRAGASLRASALASLYAWLLLLQNMAPRGQTLCFPLFLAFVALLFGPARADDQRPRSGRLLVLFSASYGLSFLWASLHGSFLTVFFLAGATGLGALLERRGLRATLPALSVSLGVTLGASLGPLGLGIWEYLRQNTTLPANRDLIEWFPPDFASFDGLRLALALTLWLVLFLRRPRGMPPSHLLLLLGLGVLALRGTRFIAWFGLATALPLALRLSPVNAEPGTVVEESPLLRALFGSPRRRLVSALCVAAFWAALLLRGTLGPLADGAPRPTLSRDTPVLAVDWLEKAPPGRVFAAFEYGGYLAERLGSLPCPEPPSKAPVCFPTFLDMRVWIFEDPVWERFISIATASPGWHEALDQEKVRYLLLSAERQGSALLRAARASERWTLRVDDPSGVLLERALGDELPALER